MEIQKVVNNIFRQDFKDLEVLGRTLFGAAILILGFDSVFDSGSYGSYAPSYIPFAEFLAILFGIVFVLAGFLIIAKLHLKKATSALIGVLLLFVLIVYLPTGDIYSLVQTLGLIGGALLVRRLPNADADTEDE